MRTIFTSTSTNAPSAAFLREFRASPEVGRFLADRHDGRRALGDSLAEALGRDLADRLLNAASAPGPDRHRFRPE